MISINRWFSQNAKRPLLLLGVATVAIQISFVSYILWGSIVNQTKSVKNLVTIANLALEQKNRPVLESTFDVAIEELGAKIILLCKGNQTQLVLPYGLMSCSNLPEPESFTRVLKLNAIGRPEYIFHFYLPLLDIPGPYVALLCITLGFFAITLGLILKIQRRFTRDILEPLEKNLLSDESIPILQLEEMRTKIKNIQQTKEKEAVASAIVEHKTKIAHNIRSLVQTLRSLQSSIQYQLPENKQSIFNNVVEGISNILSDLSQRPNTEEKAELIISEEAFFNHINEVNERKSKIEVEDILKSTVEQKKFEFRSSKSHVKLSLKIANNLNFCFLDIAEMELRSILSNLLNNAAELTYKGSMKIDIVAKRSVNSLEVRIKDNGSGISEENLSSIFKRDFTVGKENGTGYGLFHAKMFLESWGGSINVEDTDSAGTTFLLQIPLWRPEPFKINDGDTLVILDDDNFIHETWKNKINDWAAGTNKQVDLKLFNSPKEMIDWMSDYELDYSSTHFYIDNDLGDEFEKGSKLIKSLGIEELSKLITNRYDDKDLIEFCRVSNISYLPKSCIFNQGFNS